jgi:hypothetical protein
LRVFHAQHVRFYTDFMAVSIPMKGRVSSVEKVDILFLGRGVRALDALYLGIVLACFASTWGLLCLLKRL